MNSTHNEQINTKDPSDPFGFSGLLSTPPKEAIRNASGSYNSSERYASVFTDESVKNFLNNRFKENYDRIKQSDPFLADVYKNLMGEHQELRCVQVVNKDISGNAEYYHLTQAPDGSLIQQICFNLQNPDTYLRPESLKKGDNFGLDYVLKTIAFKTGAASSEICRNKRLVTAFIMLHEFGHALDFILNYLNREAAKEPREAGRNHILAQALRRADTENNNDRLASLMTLPIPGQIDSDTFSEGIIAFANRLKALGIDPNNHADVYLRMQKGYREMNDESFADNFATKYILKHYDDFFIDAKASNPSSSNSSEKVKTHIGEWRRPGDDLDMLGLTEGQSIKLTKYRQSKGKLIPDPSFEKIEGFLANKIALGKEITLLEGSDPFENKNHKKLPKVNDILFAPMKEDGKVTNYILIQLNSGSRQNEPDYYRVEPTNTEQEIVKLYTKDIEKYLSNFKVGSIVMLMKRELNNKSCFKLGEIIGGKLEQPYDNARGPIAIGSPIYLSSAVNDIAKMKTPINPDFVKGGETSPVYRVFRKWKSYYITTNTSTYEIIPYI